jgi:hypothetical protein
VQGAVQTAMLALLVEVEEKPREELAEAWYGTVAPESLQRVEVRYDDGATGLWSC